MNKQSKNSLRIIPLEERVVFDAAIGAVLAQAAPVQNSAPIIYVNQNATGSVHDGSSWANAYLDLQSALAQAGATSGPEQVWVAKGDYSPGNSASSTYNLPDNVALYGGFGGFEPNVNARNVAKNTTILDGGGVVATILTDNGNTVTIDGFKITGANNTSGNGGGIMVLNSPSLTITNDVFTFNSAINGGGIFSIGSQLKVTNSIFDHNTATGLGGAIESLGADTLSIRNSTFTYNSSQANISEHGGGAVTAEFVKHVSISDSLFDHNSALRGGAVVARDAIDVAYIHDSVNFNTSAGPSAGLAALYSDNVTVDQCSFTGNSAPNGFGGGMFIRSTTFNATVTNSTFTDNIAFVAGGLQSDSNGVFTVSGSTFVNNTAIAAGGAISDAFNGSDIFINNKFMGNKATDASSFGGALDIEPGDGSILLQNNLFLKNSAAFGGAVDTLQESGPVTLINNIFSNNTATRRGGAYLDAFEGGSVPLTITGNVFANNSAPSGNAVWLDGSQASVNGSTNTADWLNLLKNSNAALLSDDIFIL